MAERQTILIIDDVQENLRLLAKILQNQGYKVRPIRNAYRGLMIAQQEAPDLILLDIKMPELNGFELCRQLKADDCSRDIPVIFISALDEVFDKLQAFQVGGVDYITKPFEEAELLARIETQLTMRQLRQNLQTANETLEEKVQLRTTELNEANQRLQAEIVQCTRYQDERERLFAVVSQQSEQIRTITTLLIETQQTHRQDLAQGLREEIATKIRIVLSDLNIINQIVSPHLNTLLAVHLENATQLLNQIENYISQVVGNLPQPTTQEQQVKDNPLIKLSERERQVLQLLGTGKSTAEIADIVNIAPGSVHTYKQRIRRKLDIPDLHGLMKFALEHTVGA